MSSISSHHDAKPKHDLKIALHAIVCHESKLRGDITIGAHTIVHPRATIIAEAGPIIIGESNIIEEQAHIINRLPPGADPSSQIVMEIGNGNVFEVDCLFESTKMGDQNVLEVKSHVGREVEIKSGCIIGAACKLTGKEVLPENTVVYGRNCARRIAMDKPPIQTLQIEFLTKTLVNYHHLKKPRSANS
ncbi:dynactin subunit 6 [Frankliniella occidentalis]|uniref:Dynactin subunit 6 n=1 Tax=Frankliniella occidentalis TaxID=133901 RepID=A0A6J1TN59_FRAOC|nr:dynactin subunit 6 [Frankliniella occidentalis]